MSVAGQAPARTLLLALDAVPLRIVRAARRAGAFDGWPEPAAMVAPFPSVTHVCFAALFEPFGAPAADGYEIRHFDAAANHAIGANPLTYGQERPAWSRLFDAPHRSLAGKIADYVSSPRGALAEFHEVAEAVLGSPDEVVLGYVGATDGLLHLYDDDSAVELLCRLGERLGELCDRHARQRGRQLRVVLYSDHGCGRAAVRYAPSLAPLLRATGLRVVDRLEAPRDVVLPTFGIVNYGALFLADPGLAADAAEAASSHDAVDVVAFAPDPGSVTVLAHGSGRARVHWRDGPRGRRYAYRDLGGDPLHLAAAGRQLAERGLTDGDGTSHESDWLAATVDADYPDPLRRLHDALLGDRVRNRATVLLSLGPGWSWGWRSAYAGGLVRGGGLKGTHGGLDRESSLGFLLVDDAAVAPAGAVPAHEALRPFADLVRARHA